MKRAVILLLCAVTLFAETAKKPLPWLGIAFRVHRDAGGAGFLHIERVAPESPAQRAKLQPGDLVSTINGQRVDFSDDLELLLFLGDRKPGERVKFGVVRAGKPLTMIVTVAVMPESRREGWERGLAMARQLRLDGRR